MSILSFIEYSVELRQAIQIAQSIAKEFSHSTYSPSHLLKGILHDDIGLSSALVASGKDIHYLRNWADIRIKRHPKSVKSKAEPAGDDRILKLLEVADIIRLKLSLELTTPICVLVALCRPGVAYSLDQLKTLPLEEKELLEMELRTTQEVTETNTVSIGSGNTRKGDSSIGVALRKYCINMTLEAKDGKSDPIVGRDRELQELAKILGRRIKPNVIIYGEPGVGKTALIEGFCQRIVDEKVPFYLVGAEVFSLDMGALIAGATYKGEIEDRLKSIIKDLKEFDAKAILFIDEIHSLLDVRGGAAGAANLLKPELARGVLTVIGATTFAEYRKYIEKDDAFKRRFDVLEVKEPTPGKALRMLKTLMPKYEEHHKLKIREDSLQEAVHLAMRYMKDRQLPDAAIDLVDRTMASAAMMKDATPKELKALENELGELKKAFEISDLTKYLAELIWFDSQIKDRINPILLGRITDLKDVSKIDDVKELEGYLITLLKSLREFNISDKEYIEASDIAAVVAYATGIPIGKIQADERDKLERMIEHLKRRVIGQDHAIASLSNAINISRAGLSDKNRPVGSFFFLGPTGTGKTELAKSLAAFLFNDENALIRFDMSEFTEKHTAQFLIGAPPGYVGYEEGGALVNAIRQQPYSIVLFDEIEKAHPEVFKTFLQILDDGKLSDKLGKEGDFTNAIILFTSNIGSEYIIEQFKAEAIPDQQSLTQAMGRHFKDEFLGRLTEIIPFAPISEETVVKIFAIQLNSLQINLKERGIELSITDEATKHLAMKGFSPRFGARPLRRVIMNELQKPLARKIISGEIQENQKISIALEFEDSLSWTIT